MGSVKAQGVSVVVLMLLGVVVGVLGTMEARAAFSTAVQWNTTAQFNGGSASIGTLLNGNQWPDVQTITGQVNSGTSALGGNAQVPANNVGVTNAFGDEFMYPSTGNGGGPWVDPTLRSWNWVPCSPSGTGTVTMQSGAYSLSLGASAKRGSQVNSYIVINGNLQADSLLSVVSGDGLVRMQVTATGSSSVTPSTGCTTTGPGAAIRANVAAGGYTLGFYALQAPELQQGALTGALTGANYIRVTHTLSTHLWAGYYSPDGITYTQVGNSFAENEGATHMFVDLYGTTSVGQATVFAFSKFRLSGTASMEFETTNDGSGVMYHGVRPSGYWESPSFSVSNVRILVTASGGSGTNYNGVVSTISVHDGVFGWQVACSPGGVGSISCDVGVGPYDKLRVAFSVTGYVGSGLVPLNMNLVRVIDVQVQTGAGPSASFTVSPTVPKPGATATFTATMSADFLPIIFYEWAWGDGSPVVDNVNPATHAFAAAGTYSVSLFVQDSIGQTTTVANNVIVSFSTGGTVPPAPWEGAPTPVEPIPPCTTSGLESSGLSLVQAGVTPLSGLLAASQSQVGSYEFSFQDKRPDAAVVALTQIDWGDGTQDTLTAPKANHTYAAGGSYVVRVIEQNTLGEINQFTGTADTSGTCSVNALVTLSLPVVLAVLVVTVIAMVVQKLTGKQRVRQSRLLLVAILANGFLIAMLAIGLPLILPFGLGRFG